MDEIKVWAFIVGQIGVPTAIVLWYFLIERPNQRKREEALEKRLDDRLDKLLTEERTTCDTRRAEDRQHALELAKLGGEIHLTATRELKEVGGRQTEAIERLEARMEKVLEEFVDGIHAVQTVAEEIRKRKQ